MLTPEHQAMFLEIAKLVSLIDDELTFDNNSEEEKLFNDNFEGISFLENEYEIQTIRRFSLECGINEVSSPVKKPSKNTSSSELISGADKIPKMLLIAIGCGVLKKHLNDPGERLHAGIGILRNIVSGCVLPEASEAVQNEGEDEGEENPCPFTVTVAKVMLFELMLLAMAGGEISDSQWCLIEEFANLVGVEHFVLEDLRERAVATNKEASRTLALILE